MPHTGSYHTLFLFPCTVGVGLAGSGAGTGTQQQTGWGGGGQRETSVHRRTLQHGAVALCPITSPPPGSHPWLLVPSFLSLLIRITLGLHKVGLSVGQLLLEHRAMPGMGVLCGVVLLLLLLIASMDAISLVSSAHRNPSYRLQ